jgi:hypothetical protein
VGDERVIARFEKRRDVGRVVGKFPPKRSLDGAPCKFYQGLTPWAEFISPLRGSVAGEISLRSTSADARAHTNAVQK